MKQSHKRYKISVVIQEIIDEPGKSPVERVVDAKYSTQIVHALEFHKIPAVRQHYYAEDLLKASTHRVVRELASVFVCDIKS